MNNMLTFGFAISFAKLVSEKQALLFAHFVKISNKLRSVNSSGRLFANRTKVFLIDGVTLASVPFAMITIADNEPAEIAAFIISSIFLSSCFVPFVSLSPGVSMKMNL